MKLLPKANHNSFVGNSALIFLSRFFPNLASVAVGIYFSYTLDTSVYGEYVNFWTRLFLISAFASLGLQSFLNTYTPVVIAGLIKELQARHYLLLAAWIIVVAIIFAMQAHAGSFLLPFIFLIMYTVSGVMETLLMVFRNLWMLIWMNILHAIAFCWLHYMFATGSFNLQTLFWYTLAIGVVKLIVYCVYFYRGISRTGYSSEVQPDMDAVRSLWLNMGSYDVLQIAFKWVDKFVVGWLFTSSVSAIYYNGSRDVPFLPLLLGAVGSAALMQLSHDKADDAPLVIMNKSGRILSSLVFPVFFFLACFRYEFIDIVFSNKYHEAVPVFLMSIMVLPLRAYSFTVVLQNKHKGGLINIGAVLDMVVALALMYPLYLLLGLPGIALSFVISTYLQAAYYIHHTSKLLNVGWMQLIPIGNWAIKLIVFATLFIGIHYLLSQYYTTQIVLICGILMVMLVSGISFLMEIRATKHKYGAEQET